MNTIINERKVGANPADVIITIGNRFTGKDGKGNYFAINYEDARAFLQMNLWRSQRNMLLLSWLQQHVLKNGRVVILPTNAVLVNRTRKNK